jgi:hypothetical protein
MASKAAQELLLGELANLFMDELARNAEPLRQKLLQLIPLV